MISQVGDQELKSVFATVCDLCGYPRLTDDKYRTLADFTRAHFKLEPLESIINAFDMLAAGKLDDKLDGLKSLTAMALSRTMESYRRNCINKNVNENIIEVDGKWVDRWPLNPECQEILKAKTGKFVYWNDQVSEEDRNILMQHYYEKARDEFNATGSIYAITDSMFDYLQRIGLASVRNGVLYRERGFGWEQIADAGEINEMTERIKKETTLIKKSNSMFRGVKVIESPQENIQKRAMTVLYIQNL